MTALEAYESFLIKLNRNDSNSNIHVPRGKFVIIYNEQADKWLAEKLAKGEGTDYLLLEDDIELVLDGTHIDHYDYTLPENFFDLSSLFCVANKGKCSRVLDIWPVKDKNVRVLLRDSNYKPSFEYEETLCTVVDKSLKVYFTDFKVNKLYISYYKEPKDIDIEGYIKSNNQPSTTIDPDDLPSFAVNEIVNRCVLEVQGITENAPGFQIAKDRIINEK